MKKYLVLALVIALLTMSVVPAFAAEEGPIRSRNGDGGGYRYGYPPFALAGEIVSIDAEARTVTVEAICGNIVVRPYIGDEVTLTTNDMTKFLLRNPDATATPITFDDLKVGDQISAHGRLVEGVWKTTRITVGALLACIP
jgi:hypothetical protein